MPKDEGKRAAALRSLDFVEDGSVVGLGSGSTASYAIRFLGERVRAGLRIRGIPTSADSRELAQEVGIPLTDFEECPQIDLTIDGADEIDPHLNLIKGGGGALLREKIVAWASRRVIIVADSSKQVPVLGASLLPVEVVSFAQIPVARRLAALGAATVRMRRGPAGDPFLTEGGHRLLDCGFGHICDPGRLASELDRTPGVVEHGLFLGLADRALIGRGSQVVEVRRTGTL
jgi:ribose 5-phosphate isomerase A